MRVLLRALPVEPQLRLQRLQNAVDLFKALGGGWSAGNTTVAAAGA